MTEGLEIHLCKKWSTSESGKAASHGRGMHFPQKSLCLGNTPKSDASAEFLLKTLLEPVALRISPTVLFLTF